MDAWRADGLGDDVADPVAEVRSLIELLGRAVEDSAKLEQTTKHDGWRVAATRQKVEYAFRRFEHPAYDGARAGV